MNLQSSPGRVFASGLQSGLPIIAGYYPVAVAFGIAASAAGLSVWQTLLVSVLVFAGASQFVLISFLGSGVSLLGAALITLGLNLRHLLYGTNLSPQLSTLSTRDHLLVAFGLTDEVFATAQARLQNIAAHRRFWWLLGLEVAAYTSWVSGTWLGSAGGNWLAQQLGLLQPALAFALPALFFALLLPACKGPTLRTVLAALLLTAGFQYLGMSATGIFVAALVAPLVGLLWH
ncbi:MAG TPA: branched-chain amino acid ABC transporter permease [Gammaproteobacteria bacterium]|nr:branched-chain amino acid ABC transporter permease [Gammaproteobacteria bacterium]